MISDTVKHSWGNSWKHPTTVWLYLVEGVNDREAAESGDGKDFCQKVSSHEVIDRLMQHQINIFNEHLSEQPVCLRVTGQKNGVLLGGLLMQLGRKKKKKFYFTDWQ